VVARGYPKAQTFFYNHSSAGERARATENMPAPAAATPIAFEEDSSNCSSPPSSSSPPHSQTAQPTTAPATPAPKLVAMWRLAGIL